MKKFTTILAAATFVVALSSCGSKPAETTEATTEAATTEAAATIDSATAVIDSATAVIDSTAAKM